VQNNQIRQYASDPYSMLNEDMLMSRDQRQSEHAKSANGLSGLPQNNFALKTNNLKYFLIRQLLEQKDNKEITSI